MATVLLALLNASPCFVPDDLSPGWKRVPLPPEAPSLAAPTGVPQFRSDTTFEVKEERDLIFLSGTKEHLGTTTFELRFPGDTRAAAIRFAEPLRGAKVDVTAWSPQGRHTLMHEQRIAGDTVSLSWGQNELSDFNLRVRQHFRSHPVIRSLATTRRITVMRQSVPTSAQASNSLFYLQPEGLTQIKLCDAPDRSLSWSPKTAPPEITPRAVTVHREAP